MDDQGERISKQRSVEIEGQGERGSEWGTRRRSAACSENQCEVIRSERKDIVAEGSLPIVPENENDGSQEEAIQIANDNEIQEIQAREEALDQGSSGPRNVSSLVPENLLALGEAIQIYNGEVDEEAVEIANDNQTEEGVIEEAIEEDGSVNQQHLQFIERNSDDDDETDSDDDYETKSEVGDIDDDFDSRSVDDEIAGILATDFPHLIAEQSAERQITEEVLRRLVGRGRQLLAALEAYDAVIYEVIALGERRRRSLGMETSRENEMELWDEGFRLADAELIERNWATRRRLQAMAELSEEASLDVQALIERTRTERRLVLRTMSISEHHINNNTITSSCPICQIDFKLDEEASQVQCGHLYHPPCISRWLGFSNTCPVCRFQN